jgi:hypothetical protein
MHEIVPSHNKDIKMRKYVPYLFGCFLATSLFFFDVVNEKPIMAGAVIIRYGVAFIGSFLLTKYFRCVEKSKDFLDKINDAIFIKNKTKIWAKCSFFWGCGYIGLGFGIIYVVTMFYAMVFAFTPSFLYNSLDIFMPLFAKLFLIFIAGGFCYGNIIFIKYYYKIKNN